MQNGTEQTGRLVVGSSAVRVLSGMWSEGPLHNLSLQRTLDSLSDSVIAKEINKTCAVFVQVKKGHLSDGRIAYELCGNVEDINYVTLVLAGAFPAFNVSQVKQNHLGLDFSVLVLSDDSDVRTHKGVDLKPVQILQDQGIAAHFRLGPKKDGVYQPCAILVATEHAERAKKILADAEVENKRVQSNLDKIKQFFSTMGFYVGNALFWGVLAAAIAFAVFALTELPKLFDGVDLVLVSNELLSAGLIGLGIAAIALAITLIILAVKKQDSPESEVEEENAAESESTLSKIYTYLGLVVGNPLLFGLLSLGISLPVFFAFPELPRLVFADMPLVNAEILSSLIIAGVVTGVAIFITAIALFIDYFLQERGGLVLASSAYTVAHETTPQLEEGAPILQASAGSAQNTVIMEQQQPTTDSCNGVEAIVGGNAYPSVVSVAQSDVMAVQATGSDLTPGVPDTQQVEPDSLDL